jgi:myo-inositol-1-phosphate synthase
LEELAIERGVLHVGRDGKTGETLMKSVLAPMFAARNLQVMSWVGHNIFGNLDGKVLDDPVNKANKVRSKDHLLTEILGYHPQTLVSIEYIESLGDWKTAWDHIHFRGFLDTQMTLQFIWQGCDSLLAAPLVLDLVRFTEREQRRGKSGVMSFLASFFKSPMGCEEPRFQKQVDLLHAWAAEVAAGD